MLKTALSIIALSVLAGSAVASDQTPGLDKRQENQERRVEAGVESGQLTEREAQRMENAAGRLEDKEAKAKEDGVVTKKERVQLNRQANRNSKRIAKQKHDRQGDRTKHRDTNGDGK
jgi:hypothetical protein